MRGNEDFDQIGADHPVRKLISKFRKISQENRLTSQSSSNTVASSAASNKSLQVIPETIVELASAESIDSSSGISTVGLPSSLQLLCLPNSSTNKQRDKVETISERIETQVSDASQITSVNQSPPLHRPPKSSKWKWLKTGSTEFSSNSSSNPLVSNVKLQQRSTNPFDPNLSDVDLQWKTTDCNEHKQSIPLSLFIPKSARRASINTTEEESNKEVSYFKS